MPRLLFLNRCYWPDSEATGQLLQDLCEHLAGEFDVHVVCGQPNSPKSGESFQRLGVQQHNGVSVHRLSHSQYAKRFPAGRIMNLLSFARATDKYLKREHFKADIIFSETDPFMLPIIGAKHALRSGAIHISYLQDIYPDIAIAIGKAKAGLVTNYIRNRLQQAYRQSARVIVLGSCMRDRLLSPPWSIDPQTVQIIPNWADCEALDTSNQAASAGSTLGNPFRIRHHLQDHFVVMHSGNMGMTQRLDVLVKAAASPDWPSGAVLLLVGDGASRPCLERQIAALQRSSHLPAGRVRMLPYQPRESLADSLSAADLHVVSMHQNITGCLCPSKLYGILAAGRPVLAVASDQTDLCRTVSEHQVGVCCTPGDEVAIARQIATLAKNKEQLQPYGLHARELAITTFDRKIVQDAFRLLLQQTLLADSEKQPANKQ